jgi:pSer/pThr/pTyr-binding forkhead associated (FHA) protein
MKLSVFKNNAQLDEVDLSAEIIGLDDSEISFYIGRSEDCHIHLDDKKVSREHARISFKRGSWQINQISGFGGLIVNGVMTDSKELLNGDVVSIGPYVINTFGLTSSAQIVSETVDAFSDQTQTMAQSGMNEQTETIMEKPIGVPDSGVATDTDLGDDLNIDGESDDDGVMESPDFTSDEFAIPDGDDFGVEDSGIDSADGSLGESLEQLADSPDFTSTDFGDSGGSNDSGDDFDIDGGPTKTVPNDDEDSVDEPTGMFNLSEEGFESGSGGEDEELFGEEETEGFESGDVAEEGYEDDGFNDDYAVDSYEDDDDKTQVISAFAKFELEIFGELAPFDKFIVDKPDTIIGRDPEKCDIVLNDPEVSGQHAVLKKNNITCVIEDLNSGNGTLLNGERVNKSALTNNDEFIIGSTTFTVHVISELIQQESERLMPVEENQIVEVEEIVEVTEDDADKTGVRELFAEGKSGDFAIEGGATASSGSFIDSLKNDPEKRKKLLIYAVVVIGLWVFLEEEKPTKPVITKEEKSRLLEKKKKAKKSKNVLSRKFNAEEIEFLEGTYLLAKEFIDQGKYREALSELDKIQLKLKQANVSDYKQTSTLREVAKQGLAKLEELERKQQAEIDRKQRMAKVKELVKRARVAVKERKADAAEAFFSQIIELDPDNFDVPQLKIEIEAWKKEQDRIAIEKAQKEADRKRMVDALAPGKSFYLKKEWYKAILKLEDFLRLKQMDEDLVTDATKMLAESKKTIGDIVNPLLGKARSLSEGQDLKGAYEVYAEILETDPTYDEALNEMNAIREKLTIRSRKIYREALISESLSLFDDAKEKFQEVQQVAPADSDYYKKATVKLKDYLD